MAKENQSLTSKMMSISITIICLAVFLYALLGLFQAFMDYYQNRKLMSEMQNIYYQENPAENGLAGSTTKGIRTGFEGLLAQNQDVVGWITIEDTQIDYPILHSSDNIEYLTTNYYGDESRAGSIFLDYRNDITSSDENTVIYGHRMKDGSMFQHLTKFLDEDFFTTHQTFEYNTLYESYEAEIFAVYHTLTDFDYIQTEFPSDEAYEQLLINIKSKSKYETDIQVNIDDQIITLSTCDYKLDPEHGRLVVHAKLVKKT